MNFITDRNTLRETCISFQWDVEIKDVLSLEGFECIQTPYFYLNNVAWFLIIEIKEIEKPILYIQFYDTELETRTRILCSTSIKVGTKVIQGNSSRCMNVKTSIPNCITFIDTSELSAYMESDSKNCSSSMTISCTIRLYDHINEVAQATRTSPSSNRAFENLSKSLESVLLDEYLSDLKIKVGEREFQAHRVILAARSPVFSSMFKHEMSESSIGTINIEDCDPDSFGDFLKFLYIGNLDVVTSFNALNIYKIAHKYELKDLQDKCSARMSKSLTTDNICDVLDLSVTYDEKKLLRTATQFFIKHANDVFSTKKWLIYMREKNSLANELLKKMSAYYSLKISEMSESCSH